MGVGCRIGEARAHLAQQYARMWINDNSQRFEEQNVKVGEKGFPRAVKPAPRWTHFALKNYNKIMCS